MSVQTSRSQALRAGLSRDAKGRAPTSPWGPTDASGVSYLAGLRGNSQGGEVTKPSATTIRINGNATNGTNSTNSTNGTNGTNGANGQNGNGNGNGNGLTKWGTAIHPALWLAAGGMFLWFWSKRKK